ncbi:MAG: metallophosphoesterase, partial [Candidatus Aenigmatarchaeota archaeon]
MVKKMRIFAASDLHGDFRLVKKLASFAEKENVDAVIICGDISTYETKFDGMIGPFVSKGMPVMFVPGNHDSPETPDFLVEKYKIKNLHGYSAKIDDVGFFGCGAANIPGMNWISEADIYRYLKRGYMKIRECKKKVMVTHMHPAKGLIEKLSIPGSGSMSIRKADEKFKPDIHVCGHMHETEGLEEKIGKT